MDCFQPIILLTYTLRPTQVDGVCADVLGDLTLAPLDTWTYLSALGLTCMVEAPFYLAAFCLTNTILGKKSAPMTLRRMLMSIVTINLATHPMVVFGFPTLFAAHGRPLGEAMLCGEIFAPVIEALLLLWAFDVPWRRAWIGSVTANLCSWWLGSLLA